NSMGRNTLDLYICPSDRSAAVPLVNPGGGGSNGPVVPEEEAYVSWQYNGNSYPINWYWVEYFTNNPFVPGADYPLNPMNPYNMGTCGQMMLKRKAGGPASKFTMFYEQAMNGFMLDARPDGSSVLPRIRGWHRRFSSYTVSFLDGSASYMYID